MKLITFDPFRTLGLPGVHYIKPELMHDQRARLLDADWLLFPAYWQLHSLHCLGLLTAPPRGCPSAA